MQRCAACSQENPPIARFCLACGSALAGPDERPEEERRVVSVLFVDLVGFTARAEKLDPEDVRAILAPTTSPSGGRSSRSGAWSRSSSATR